MTDNRPVIWWVRRDLRLADNPALHAAAAAGAPVIPVFILGRSGRQPRRLPRNGGLGSGPRALAEALEASGSRLILRRGDALADLRALIGRPGRRRCTGVAAL